MDALPPGLHTIEFDFKYNGISAGALEYNNFSGVGRPGIGTLKVDGKVVATKTMPKTLPMISASCPIVLQKSQVAGHERDAMLHQATDVMNVAGQPIQLGHDDRGLLLSRDIQGREQRGTMIVSAAFGLSECLDEAAPQRLLRQTIHLIHELQGRIPLLTTRPSISCTELAGILKIHPDSRFVQSIRNDVRFFIQTKGRLSIPKLRQEVARLYRLNSRALSSAQGAQKLACALADMPADVREWLARCNPKDRNIPTTEEVTSLATCAGAVQRLRLILSYGTDLERKGRKRPTGKRSRSVRPLLRVPPPLMAPVQTKGKKKGRPRGNAEREFVRNLGLTYLDATGKRAPYKVMHLDLHLDLRGPFSTFVHRCFELVGVPSGHVTSLINEIGKERRKAAGSETEYPKDFRAYLDERERFYSGGASRK